MIYRPATPADGPDMLRLIESQASDGNIRIVYSRRPDAYRSYLMECADAEMVLCIGDDESILAQFACLPRKLYIDREVCTVGYVTGLHKTTGTRANVMKLLETGYVRSSAKQFYCSVLDGNQSAFDRFAKRGLIHPICDYTTYLLNPAVIKPMKQKALKTPKTPITSEIPIVSKMPISPESSISPNMPIDPISHIEHGLTFRRATLDDSERLLHFYNEAGMGYSYFPVFSSMDDFSGLSVSDFFILENGDTIIAAGALWNQKAYKQYIVLEYAGVYRIATACNPLLRALHYPPLPGKNEAAHFAYVSFLISRENDSTIERLLLGEISATAHNYDFLTIGAANGTALGHYLNSIKSIKIGSRLCVVDHDKSGVIENTETPVRFECALL